MFEVNLQLIKSQRMKKGYTLQYMSDKLGLKGKAAYLRRENGEYNFKPEEIPVVSKTLNIPLKKFFIQKVSKREINEKVGVD